MLIDVVVAVDVELFDDVGCRCKAVLYHASFDCH